MGPSALRAATVGPCMSKSPFSAWEGIQKLQGTSCAGIVRRPIASPSLFLPSRQLARFGQLCIVWHFWRRPKKKRSDFKVLAGPLVLNRLSVFGSTHSQQLHMQINAFGTFQHIKTSLLPYHHDKCVGSDCWNRVVPIPPSAALGKWLSLSLWISRSID